MDHQKDRQPSAPRREEEDFGALFENSLRTIKPGEVVRGHVVQVTRDYVTVDIGYKSEGQIPIQEFLGRDGAVEVSQGDEIDVYFDSSEGENGGIALSRSRAEQLKVWTDIERAFQASSTVEGTIVGKVKGGLKVDIGVSAFLPGSHADIRPARNLDRYIGQRGKFAILKFNRSRGNVVVSRRAVMEREREVLKEETLKVLEEGVILEGQVKNITDYGAFIDLGGIDGLLHITDMSWGRVAHPSEIVKVGDQLKVVILKYDPSRERVSLGMKQILPDPWSDVRDRYPSGTRIHGKVVSLTDYGAFVELEKGIEGLVHVSEMSWTKRVTHPRDVLAEGQEVDVQVLDVDPQNRRISLGLKQTEPNPWDLVRVNHPVGSQVRGKVKSITDFGVFVGVAEGIDGLVHVSDLHWTKKVKHPSEVYRKGDDVEAVVLGVDVENERISLGVKQLEGDPFAEPGDVKKGAVVTCEVLEVKEAGIEVKISGTDFTTFIKRSELARDRNDQRAERFAVGEKVDARVIQFDKKARKVQVSIKALEVAEEKEAIAQYGSSDSGATLGDILGTALKNRDK